MASSESRSEQERRTRWSFAFHGDNTWFWEAKRANGKLERSEVRLEALADCLTDAMAHGYIAWERAAERRRNAPEELLNGDRQ